MYVLSVNCNYNIFSILFLNVLASVQSTSGTALRVAGAKLSVSENITEYIRSVKVAIDYARREKAEILLNPKGSLSGYRAYFDPKEVEEGLIEVVDPEGNWKYAMDDTGIDSFVYPNKLY